MNRSALSQWAGWALACTGERAVGRRRVVRDARRECRRKGGASTIAPIVQRRRGVGWRWPWGELWKGGVTYGEEGGL